MDMMIILSCVVLFGVVSGHLLRTWCRNRASSERVLRALERSIRFSNSGVEPQFASRGRAIPPICASRPSEPTTEFILISQIVRS